MIALIFQFNYGYTFFGNRNRIEKFRIKKSENEWSKVRFSVYHECVLLHYLWKTVDSWLPLSAPISHTPPLSRVCVRARILRVPIFLSRSLSFYPSAAALFRCIHALSLSCVLPSKLTSFATRRSSSCSTTAAAIWRKTTPSRSKRPKYGDSDFCHPAEEWFILWVIYWWLATSFRKFLLFLKGSDKNIV